jgi:hypothetical protein
MFPLKEMQEAHAADASVLPTFDADLFKNIQPTVGEHSQRYVEHRSSALPDVLRRLIQRGAATAGVEEDTLRYSIRWIERRLKKAQAAVTRLPRQT